MSKLVKLMSVLLVVVLLPVFALAEVDREKAYGGYEDEVVLTIAKPVNASPNFGNPNDSQADNEMTRLIKERLNVSFDLVWESDDYVNKLAMQVISDDLPDVFYIPSTHYLLYRQLVDNGSLYDMSELVKEYSGDYLQYFFDSYNGRTLSSYTEADGSMYCIAAGNYDFDGHSLLWLRKDWLDALGMEEPTSIEEIEKILIAFRDNYNNAGLVLNNTDPLGGYGTAYSASPLACVFNAYPGTWVYDEDGKIVYGSLNENMKKALEVLAKWYKEGLIDKEFATRDASGRNALIASGQSGSTFTCWNLPWNISDIVNQEGAVLTAVNAPLAEDDRYNIMGPSSAANILCVNAKCEHPEAVLKVMNLEFETWRGIDQEAYKQIAPDINAQWTAVFPTGSVNIEKADALLSSYWAAKEMIETGAIADETPYTAQELRNAKKSYDYINGIDTTGPMFIQYYGRYVAPQCFADPEKLNIVYPAFSFTTESMSDFWPNLKAMEQTAILSIITGAKPVDYFDEFVQEWYAQGGELITAEVNEMAAK